MDKVIKLIVKKINENIALKAMSVLIVLFILRIIVKFLIYKN